MFVRRKDSPPKRTINNPKFIVNCACGCGEQKLVTIRKYKASKTGRFFMSIRHYRLWQAMTRRHNKHTGRRMSRATIKRHNIPLRCLVCGTKHRPEVHHKDRNPLNIMLSNLVVLCEDHHRQLHALDYVKPRRWYIVKPNSRNLHLTSIAY